MYIMHTTPTKHTTQPTPCAAGSGSASVYSVSAPPLATASSFVPIRCRITQQMSLTCFPPPPPERSSSYLRDGVSEAHVAVHGVSRIVVDELAQAVEPRGPHRNPPLVQQPHPAVLDLAPAPASPAMISVGVESSLKVCTR